MVSLDKIGDERVNGKQLLLTAHNLLNILCIVVVRHLLV